METPAHAPRKDAVLHTLSKAWDSGTESASGIMQGAKHHLLEEPMRDAIRQAMAPHMTYAEQVEEVRKSNRKQVKAIAREVSMQFNKEGYHLKPLEEVCDEFGCESTKTGLTSSQVTRNLKKFGANELGTDKPTPFWVIYCRQLYQPLILILFTLFILTVLNIQRDIASHGHPKIKNCVKITVVTTVILVVTILNARGQYNTANALAELLKEGAQMTTVRRDGKECQIEVPDIVPGDVIIMRSGDTVPADARVVMSEDLQTVEKTLTGEPHEKTKKLEAADDPTASFHDNLVYSSTAVVGGKGEAVVIRTGLETEIGKIAARLKGQDSGRSQLQKLMDTIGGVIICISVILIIMMTWYEVTVNYCTKDKYPGGLSTCPMDEMIDALFSALSIGTIMLPTTLLLMVTTSLTRGALILAKINARVTKVTAVETLGSCTVICSDKTGTLTEGEMTATEMATVINVKGKCQVNCWDFRPTRGFDPRGGVFVLAEGASTVGGAASRKTAASLRVSAAASRMSTGPAGGGNGCEKAADVHCALLSAYLNCDGAAFELDDEGDVGKDVPQKWKGVGNMTEKALVVAAAKGQIYDPNKKGLPEAKFPAMRDKYPSVHHLGVPFTSSRKMMGTVHELR